LPGIRAGGGATPVQLLFSHQDRQFNFHRHRRAVRFRRGKLPLLDRLANRHREVGVRGGQYLDLLRPARRIDDELEFHPGPDQGGVGAGRDDPDRHGYVRAAAVGLDVGLRCGQAECGRRGGAPTGAQLPASLPLLFKELGVPEESSGIMAASGEKQPACP